MFSLQASPSFVAKLFGFSAGCVSAAVATVYLQRMTWSGSANVAELYGTYKRPVQDAEEAAFFGPRTRALATRAWNKAIDGTVGSMATELAKQGL
eukprot:gene4908-34675_t